MTVIVLENIYLWGIISMPKIEIHTELKLNLSGLTAEEKAERAEARRLVSLCNKRIRRLEQQDLGKSSSAYRSLIKNGDPYFSVKGKDMKELRREVRQMEKFMGMATSTVRGAKNNVQEIAQRINLTRNVKDIDALVDDVNEFFEIVDKTREYLENTREIGVSIGYQEIWNVVANKIEEMDIELGASVDEITQAAIETLSAASKGDVRDMLEEAHKQFMSDY